MARTDGEARLASVLRQRNDQARQRRPAAGKAGGQPAGSPAPSRAKRTVQGGFADRLGRRFEAVVFDWDGTAVPDRRADAGRLRRVVEALCSRGFEVAVITGTHVGNIDGQLGARPRGPGRLHLLLNRGSEVFRVDDRGVHLVDRRTASPDEDAALTVAAERTVKQLGERGLRAEIVSRRLNRRKVDLIPEPEWADPPKARIAELLAAVEARLRRAGLSGLPEVVALATEAAAEAGLADPRVTSDAKHVEIGLTDKSDSARWILRDLWSRGISPGLVLIAGDEMGPLGGLPGSDSLMLVPEAERATAVSVGVEPTGVPPGVIALGGGPDAFLDLLEDQLRRREGHEVPELDPDPSWVLVFEGFDAELERVREAQLTLADGRIGTSGSPLAAHPAAAPRVLAAGVYHGKGSKTELLPCPGWNPLPYDLDPRAELRRALDLRTGILRHELTTSEGLLEAALFSSLARPGTVALRAEGPSAVLGAPSAVVSPPKGVEAETGETNGRHWVRVVASRGGVVVAASESRLSKDSANEALERLGAYAANRKPRPGTALRRAREAERAGFERLLVEHRGAWARRWEDADVVIEGDDEAQLAVRFALFHLMGSVADSGEAAVGARGLSGPAYRGHVFWDGDVFVLPFLAATHPQAARAMVEYRIRRLPAARVHARVSGHQGARFPWESAASGFDVTPTSALDRTGRIVPVRTGQLEEHITADVAWAAACYVDWTGDRSFSEGPGRTLLVETARYWASRIRIDSQGRGHIYGVIGPDEYHEPVDDNAFTNVMARWNLRRAAELVRPGDAAVSEEEQQGWLEAADSLVAGYDPSTGLYEQFAGFWDLEPLVIADVAPTRPIAADLLLGRKRVEGAQVIKQTDVLMLHHLVPDELVPGSLLPNLLFYEPRTAHGSSLSPGIHAALFARAGLLDEALGALRLANRIDLEDLTGTTAGGLHLATMGSVWQALAYGFAGLRPRDDVLEVDPRLPSPWAALQVRVRFHGARVRLRIEAESASIHADRPVKIAVPGETQTPPLMVRSSGVRLERLGESWKVVEK